MYAALTPVKDMEVVVHGAALTCPSFQQLLWAALRALVDLLGVQSFNATISGGLGLPAVGLTDSQSDGIIARCGGVVHTGKSMSLQEPDAGCGHACSCLVGTQVHDYTPNHDLVYYASSYQWILQLLTPGMSPKLHPN